jgi:hypothetical protein
MASQTTTSKKRTRAECDAVRVIQRRQVEIEMLQRGVTGRELAGLIGLSFRNFKNQKALNFPFHITRLAIEDALGRAIWTPMREFKKRTALIALWGFDPFTRTMKSIRAHAAHVGAGQLSSQLTKNELIEAVTNYLKAK